MGAQLAAVVVRRLSSREGRNRMVEIDKTQTPSSLRDVERWGSIYGNINQKKNFVLGRKLQKPILQFPDLEFKKCCTC